MSFALNFDLNAKGQSDLQRIDEIIKSLSKSTSASSTQLTIFAEWLKQGVDKGKSLESTLKGIVAAQGKADDVTRSFARSILESAKAQQEAEKQAKAHAKAIDDQARAYRQLASAQEAANRENAKRNAVPPPPPGLLDGFGKGAALGAFGLGAVGGVGLQLGRAAVEGIASAIRALTSDFANYSREVQNTSERTGLTVAQTQQWSGAARIAGVNAGALTTAMRTLSRGLAEGEDEGKKQEAVLRRLGVAATDASGQVRSTGDILLDVYRKLGALPAGAQRDFFANSLFGRGGLETLPLAGRTDELIAAVQRSGAVVQKDGIDTGRKYAEQLSQIGLAWDGLKHTLAVPIVGAISYVVGQAQGTPDKPTLTPEGFRIIPGQRSGQLPVSISGQRPTIPISGIQEAARRVFTDPSTLSNQDAYDRFVKGNLHEQLTQAEAGLAATPRPVRGQSSQSDIDAYTSAQKKVEDLRKQIIAAGSDAKKSAVEIREFDAAVRSLSGAGQSRQQGLFERYQGEVERLGGTGRLSGSQRSSLYSAYGQGSARLYADDADKVRKTNLEKLTKLQDKNVEDALKYLEEQNSEDLRARNETARKRDESLRKNDTQGIDSIRDTASRQSRILGVNADFRPIATAGQQRSITQQAIADELKVKELHASLYDIDAERYKAQREANDADLEYQLKVVEITKQRRDEFSSTFAQGASAIFRGQGRGFFQGVGQNLENTVLKNAGGLVFDSQAFQGVSNSLHLSDSNSTVGKLLKGTPFGPKDAQAVPSNTTATIANTTATTNLTSIIGQITGTPTPGVPSTGAIGIPGSLTSILGGSLPGILGLGGAASSVFTDAQGNVIPSLGPQSIAALAGAGGGYSGLSGFSSGLSHAGDLQGIFTGVSSGPGGAQSLSPSEQAGAAVGTAGIVASGATAAYNGFSRGGGRGTAQGISAVAGTAAALDPEPISKAVLAGIAVVSGIVGSFLGDPKVNRSNAISASIAKNQYLPSTALNVIQGQNGTYEDFDARGNLRTSNLSALPAITQPYIHYNNIYGSKGGAPYFDAPGGVTSPYSGYASGTGSAPVGNNATPTPNVTIIAMDSESFAQFSERNHAAIGNAVATHLQTTEGRLSNQIRYTAN